MGAKEIVLKPIPSSIANTACKRWHYSGKVVNNSQLHFGVFWHGQLEGVMQFGPSLDKRKMLGIVKGTGWNEFLELNRMAFSDTLPRNSESRALAIAMKLIRKYAPQVKWVVSFSDGCQSGDGTIYRAAGFVLTAIKKNDQIWISPDSSARESRTSLTDNRSKNEQAKAQSFCRVSATKGRSIVHAVATRTGGDKLKVAAASNGSATMRGYIDAGFAPIPGFQLRYLYFIDPTAKDRLTVPILPFSEIEKRGAGMYLGKPRERSIDSDAPIPIDEGGAPPTRSLQFEQATSNAT
jgi:hypothetical protein